MAGLVNQLDERLRSDPDASIDRALAAALPTADRPALARLCPILLQRGHDAGLTGLIVSYHRLPEPLQQQVVAAIERLFSALRQASAMRSGEAPANVVQIIRHAAEPRLTYLLSEQLRQPWQPLRRAAAGCLKELAMRAATDPEPGVFAPIEAARAQHLLPGLRDGLRVYPQHRCHELLLAIGWLMPRPARDAFALLNDPSQHAHEDLKNLLSEADQPAARRMLVPMLGERAFQDAAVLGLKRCIQAGQMDEPASMGHLLALPTVSRGLSRARQAEALWPAETTLLGMRAEALRHLPRWVQALSIDRLEKIQRLLRLGQVADGMTRLSALRRLMQMGRREVDQPLREAVALFCEDEEPAIARIAMSWLRKTDHPELARWLAGLVSSPYAHVRQMAAEQLAPLGFARLWKIWPRLEPDRRAAAARALRKLDSRFDRLLEKKLRSEEQVVQLQAVQIVRALELGRVFAGELQRLSGSTEPRIAAAASAALPSAGQADGPAGALSDERPQARAAAVQALTREQAGELRESLVPLLDDADASVRSAAVRALWAHEPGQALAGLKRMLAAADADHRRAGLKLVRAGRVVSLARQVAAMAVNDPDTQLRHEADRVARDMVQQLKAMQKTAGH